MKILHRMTAAILAVFLGVLCTGCHKAERPQAQPVNIAFLLGVADNETKVNENIEELASLPERPGTTYAFISADGAPTCIGEPGTIVDLSQRGYTDTMMERVRAGIKADLMADLNTYVPSSPQIDLAGAIQMGVRQLRANAVEGRDNVLVLYTSGKSCAGLINLAETPVYRLDIQASVPGLAAEMGVDMSFVDRLVWYCCGDFAGEEQQPLSSAEQNKLREFYKELFVALGMEESNIQFRDDLPQTECYQFDETPVSCIEVADAAYDLAELSPNLLENGNALSNQAISISEEQVQYKPDSAEFLDPVSAAKTLQPLADFLTENGEIQILLYGTCAGDTNTDYALQLGRARAESVKSVLVADGIPEDRIITATVRTEDDPYYQSGLGTGEAASVNRKTVIADASSDFGRQILENAL